MNEIKIVMPKLGMTMKKGTVIEWKKKEGEKVKIKNVPYLFVLDGEREFDTEGKTL